jgi:hypothetical protein
MNHKAIQEIAQYLVAAFHKVSVVGVAKEIANFAFGHSKINQSQDVYNLIVSQHQGHA